MYELRFKCGAHIFLFFNHVEDMKIKDLFQIGEIHKISEKEVEIFN